MLGLLAILVALDSGIERYDTSLFSDHMVQHMILTLVAPVLLLYAGPITLLLRASSAETRRRWIFPFLHSRVVRFLSFPVVAWHRMRTWQIWRPGHSRGALEQPASRRIY